MRVLVNNYLGAGRFIFAASPSEYHPKGRRNARNERCPVGAESESALAGGTPLQKTEKRGGRKTPEGPGPLRLQRLAFVALDADEKPLAHCLDRIVRRTERKLQMLAVCFCSYE